MMDQLNVISGVVVSAGVRIHQKLGPGLLESVYEVVLARDLVRLGLCVERQKRVTFEFEGTNSRMPSGPILSSITRWS